MKPSTFGQPEIKCLRCGFAGKPKVHTKGTLLMEIVLWLFLLIPGLIYSVWRSGSRVLICPKCESEDLMKK